MTGMKPGKAGDGGAAPLLFETMAVIGVGLIGGSLARAARRRGLVSRIIGVARGDATLRRAEELGVIDWGTRDIGEGVREADLVVLATPVEGILRLLPQVGRLCRPDAVVTDVGSVKAPIVREAEEVISRPGRFVGGHPVAGTEHSGVDASFETLFEDRRTILTPTERTDPRSLERVRALWEAVGSTVVSMDMDRHDRVMGFVSHLPHIVAYSLVQTVDEADRKEGNIARFSAGGFLDFTRIASSHPEMWRDICLRNREALLEALDAFSETLAHFRKLVASGDGSGLEEDFKRCRRVRETLLKGQG